MTRFTRNRPGPIGLDLGSRAIKAVQLTGRGADRRLRAAVALPRNEGEAVDAPFAARISDILERHGFAGSDVVLAAPAAQLQQDLLELPPRGSGAPLDQIAAAEIARVGKMDPGTFEIACWDLPDPPRANNTTSVMALALRHADATALLDPFDHAGLNVVAIDSQACAAARLLARSADDQRLQAVVDLGWNAGQIVFAHRGTVLFQRGLMEASLASLYRAVMSQFDVPEPVADHVLTAGPTAPATVEPQVAPDAVAPDQLPQSVARFVATYAVSLVDEIHTSFGFVNHRYPNLPVANLLLTGGGAAVRGLRELLVEKLGGTIDVADVDRWAPPAPGAPRPRGPSMFNALALATYDEGR